MMKTRDMRTKICCLLTIWLLTACLAPQTLAQLGDKNTAVAQGIDPALPQAKGVLLRRCTEYRCELELIDPASGQPLVDFPAFALGTPSAFKRSPDLRTLAVIDYGSHYNSTNGVLKLIDLAAWQVVTTTLTFDNVYDSFFFSADSKRLVVSSPTSGWPPAGQLQLIDIVRQQAIANQTVEFTPRKLSFTSDGRWLLLYGTDGSRDYTVNSHTYVALLRVPDLQVVWQQMLPAVRDGFFSTDPNASPYQDPAKTTLWEPAVAFAPDAMKLYIVHADENQLTTVDFSTRMASMVAIMPAQSWVEQLLALTAHLAKAKAFNGTTKQAVIAPDGKQLYVTTVEHIFKTDFYTETAQGVQVIDLTSGAELAQIDSQAQTLSLAPNGAQLYLHGWKNDPAKPYPIEWTEVFATANFQRMANFPNQVLEPGQRLDSKPILLSTVTGQDGHWEATALDPQSFQIIHTWTMQQSGGWGGFITQ